MSQHHDIDTYGCEVWALYVLQVNKDLYVEVESPGCRSMRKCVEVYSIKTSNVFKKRLVGRLKEMPI